MEQRRDVEAVRLVWGTGTGPTALSSYDAALAEANVHDYNVVTVSSILPADATVEERGTAPDLGPAGGRLTAVEARATAAGPGKVVAGLGWATGEGAGVVYEAAGHDEDAVATELEDGLDAGTDLRERQLDDRYHRIVASEAGADEYATAVVLAVYGRSEPI
jgi:arginine decarboxylase